MDMRRWLLAGTFVIGGCATFGGGGVSDRDVARLPEADRAQITTAQHAIDVAQTNVQTAKVQRDEARQFRKIAQNEMVAARARLEAARNAIELAHSTRDTHELHVAQHAEDAARDQLVASRAKLDYAERLVALRDVHVDESEAALKAAHADVQLEKAQLLDRNGIAANIDMTKIRKTDDAAQERLAESRARVATLSGEVQQLRTAWEDRRREYNTAARDTASFAPPPGRPMLPAVNPPRGDVNDTPATPAEPLSQERQPGIAPNP
jgi:hypothetical protein